MSVSRYLGVLSYLVLVAACTRQFEIEVSGIEPDADYPVERFEFNMFEGEQRLPQNAASGFVRINFKTTLNIAEEVAKQDVPFASYAFYPCGKADLYRQSGDIFPGRVEADWFHYSAYVPAHWSLLTVMEPSGKISRGWPAGAESNGLCFQIAGRRMIPVGLESREVRVDEAAKLLK